jgi:hypothetical protein
MAFFFPEGSRFYVSETFAAAKSITALTNASPSVATSTTHGFVDADIALIESGWEDASNNVFKLDQLTTDTFAILGLNATNLTFFPAGSGASVGSPATAKLVSNWIELPQLMGVGSQGGEPRFTEVQLLARRNAIRIPTGFTPQSWNFTLAHDPGIANYQVLLEMMRSTKPIAVRGVIGGGALALGYGYLSVNDFPQLQPNQVNQVQGSLTIMNRLVMY